MRVWLPCDAVNSVIDSIIPVGQPILSLRKQQRSIITRQDLLRSARIIFARDGFEQARLQDIAGDAGRTRGAFYAHFEDKEDVFCAIFEENVDREIAELGPLLNGISNMEKRLGALVEYLSKLSKDRERTLLNLEFKLYAIRHPLKRKRLADLHSLMRFRCSIPEINHLFPKLRRRGTESSATESLAIGGIFDGLALNHLFDPEVLDDVEFARYLKLSLRSIASRP